MSRQIEDTRIEKFVRISPDLVGDEQWLSKERINIVVAYTDVHRYIGLKRDLPWGRKLSGDMKFINTLIRLMPNSALIMGRETFQSMPRKTNIVQIVLTRNPDFNSEGVVILNDFGMAVKYCTENNLYAIVFGGAGVYACAHNYKCRIFHTVVEEGELQGDTIYPSHDSLIRTRFNISAHVAQLLQRKYVSPKWEVENDRFKEEGIAYGFFVAEN